MSTLRTMAEMVEDFEQAKSVMGRLHNGIGHGAPVTNRLIAKAALLLAHDALDQMIVPVDAAGNPKAVSNDLIRSVELCLQGMIGSLGEAAIPQIAMGMLVYLCNRFPENPRRGADAN